MSRYLSIQHRYNSFSNHMQRLQCDRTPRAVGQIKAFKTCELTSVNIKVCLSEVQVYSCTYTCIWKSERASFHMFKRKREVMFYQGSERLCPLHNMLLPSWSKAPQITLYPFRPWLSSKCLVLPLKLLKNVTSILLGFFVLFFFFLAKDMLDLYSEKCVPHTYSTVTNFHLKCKHYRSWQELKHKHLFNKLFFSEARKALTVTLHQNIYIKQQNILSKGKMWKV